MARSLAHAPAENLACAESTSPATAISSPRLLVVMGDASSLELVEEYAPGPGHTPKYFTNAVTEVQLEQGAELRHGSESLPCHMHLLLCSLLCDMCRHGQQNGILHSAPYTLEAKHMVLCAKCRSAVDAKQSGTIH